MQSLFEEATFKSIQQRIQSISENSSRLWGSMSPAQMLWHCKIPLKLVLQKHPPKLKVNFLKKMIFSLFKSSLYDDKPWKPNVPTPQSFKAEGTYILDDEKKELLQLVEQFYKRKDQEEWVPHPLFGKFTREQWGMMQYKHLDHHLRQFNT